jgi:hypothetical protein
MTAAVSAAARGINLIAVWRVHGRRRWLVGAQIGAPEINLISIYRYKEINLISGGGSRHLLFRLDCRLLCPIEIKLIS